MSALKYALSGGGLTAPTYVNIASNQASTASFVINKPTDTADGDLMIAVITVATTVTPPAGWTTVYTSTGGTDEPSVFYKTASSEGASYTFALGSSKAVAGCIVTYRNASAGFYGGLSASSTTPAAPEVNIPCSSCILFGIFTETSASTTFSTPSGMSLLTSNTDATAPSYAVFTETRSSGLTGTRTSTLSTAGYGMLFFIAPSAYIQPTPTFIASASTQNTSTGASLVINKPTGTQDGDLMVAFMGTNASSAFTWTGDTGWTEIADNGDNADLRVAYKVASSEGSSYTFTLNDSGTILSGAILTYRGAAYDAIGSFASSADPLVITGPTSAANYAKLIGITARTGSGITVTADSLMTTRVTDNDATAPSYVIADQTVGYGATGTRSFSSGSAAQTGILLTIKPS